MIIIFTYSIQKSKRQSLFLKFSTLKTNSIETNTNIESDKTLFTNDATQKLVFIKI